MYHGMGHALNAPFPAMHVDQLQDFMRCLDAYVLNIYIVELNSARPDNAEKLHDDGLILHTKCHPGQWFATLKSTQENVGSNTYCKYSI